MRWKGPDAFRIKTIESPRFYWVGSHMPCITRGEFATLLYNGINMDRTGGVGEDHVGSIFLLSCVD